VQEDTENNMTSAEELTATPGRRKFLKDAGLITAGAALTTPISTFAMTGNNKIKSKHRYRFAIGMFMQESNTFCPEMSGLQNFENDVLLFGDAVLPAAKKSLSYLGGILSAADSLGVEVVPLVAASAFPYGIVTREAYEKITGELYDRLASAGNIDGIVFVFHGSMVSATTMDPEGDVLASMRSIVGPNIPITCTFDFHCKVSQRMIDNASAFFYNNENPHLDSFDRGDEATRVCLRIAKGELDPVMAFSKPGMMVPTLYVRPPESGPMVKIFNDVFEMEKDPRVININVGAGFPWCDVPAAGVNVVPVVHKDRSYAEDLAATIAERLWAVRQDFIPTTLVPLQEAVAMAKKSKDRPVVLVDVGDNPGDGTTMDSNTILREMYTQNVRNAAVAAIRQPNVVRQCIEAGVGNDVDIALGCPYRIYGEPIEMTARVKTISDGVFFRNNAIGGPGYSSFGRTAVVEYNGIETLVTERSGPANYPQVFSRNGIDPTRKSILVIKTFKMYSEQYFEPIASSMIEVDAPGQAPVNLSLLKWKHIQRPMFPIDD